MSDFERLGQLMRSDWDRRVRHDYRFWMSDGYQDDAAMWASGERDLKIITEGLGLTGDEVFLELGCGVGRILKAALGRFSKVIGIDVSKEAISKARELLKEHVSKLELHTGNGFDLSAVRDNTADLAISFAALSSMPTDVIANYLRELHRVVKPGGTVRLQMYLGSERPDNEEDTLHLRCYSQANLRAALQACGFAVESISEFALPNMQVSFKEIGIEAVIISLKKMNAQAANSREIAALLLPPGEESVGSTLGNDLEYWMTLNYAKELTDKGDNDRAKEVLQHLANVSKTAALDVGDLLDRIVRKIEDSSSTPAPAALGMDHTDANFAVLKERFPDIWQRAAAWQGTASLEFRDTPQGLVLYLAGICLDHAEKPVTAAETWAKRLTQEDKYKNTPHSVIVGAGSGYHMQELLKLAFPAKKVSLIEPSWDVFLAALRSRDCTSWLKQLSHLAVGGAAIPEIEGEFELWIRPQAQALHSEDCAAIRSVFYGRRGLALLQPTIGVVGPIQGGTLPIMAYVYRSLLSLQQRTREFDMSGFAPGFLHLEHFVKDEFRRKGLEGVYCEMLSQALLDSINEKPIDILICMAQAPISPRVLSECRKRGIITVLWFVEDYVRFTYWQEMAKFYDFVFTIQKGRCIEAIQKAGAGEVHYLPVACDPGVHAPLKLTDKEREHWGSPVSFMGAGYHNRQQLMASLSDLPLKLWGTEWPTCRPFDRMVQEGGRRLTPAEYVKIFNATDINLNLHSSHERDGVDPFGDFLNPRTFELAASGAFQLVDKRSLLAESFEEGKEIVTFESAGELKDKIRYYLAHPEERKKIAENARARALQDHTYDQRIRQMLSIIYSSRFEQVRARLDASPWKKMLARAKPHGELYDRCERSFKRGEEAILDGLISDIVVGQGKLTETEQKLLFLFHVRKQLVRLRKEELGYS
ncbi:MAG: hypothetical protein DCC75_00260 [Proteobacteria bacterium]|nr:MAG: hypothetical protein DCC75_00260 [Pseudomonadota bacterium]